MARMVLSELLKPCWVICILLAVLSPDVSGQEKQDLICRDIHFPFVIARHEQTALFVHKILPPNTTVPAYPIGYYATIHYANFIPEGAVFCRMENTVYERCNIWLKIRAGDVDTYHRMIESGK